MASVTLSGVSSVADRILFTRRAPIVKKPLPLLTGSDLVILSPNTARVVSANFTTSDVGYLLSISGSSGGRNDGSFPILEALNSITVKLEGANFETVDHSVTIQRASAIANALKSAFNKHLVHTDTRLASPYLTHVENDVANAVTAPSASDLATTLVLLNDVRTSLLDHMANVGGDFHTNVDVWNPVTAGAALSEYDAFVLANQLLAAYEGHRIERRSHNLGDADSRTGMRAMEVAQQSAPGSLVGPFVWTLSDPRLGTVADLPEDVVVRINGIPTDAEAVFGMIGAVVLTSKPLSGDSVEIDYDYLNNPPARFLRLNSPEFVLNQDLNNGIMGLPSHRYRARSYMIDPGNTPDLISAISPKRVGWKYKAFERAYTADLNDPEKLLLNSPTRDIKYPVLMTTAQETTISYDPIVPPQSSPDSWTLEGDGEITVSNNLLLIVDGDNQQDVSSKPPFYTHALNLVSDSIVSAAFRAAVIEESPDGVFTGVGFGMSDGDNVALVGFIMTDATNLTSTITLANDIKAKFNTHLVQPTVHAPDDTASAVEIVDATSLESVVILLNALKLKYNAHVAKADPTLSMVNVHKLVDSVNEETTADAEDLDTAIALANSIRAKFNAHRTSSGVHFADDAVNEVFQVKQVGVLKNSGPDEFQENWEATSVDWYTLYTYRIQRSPDGDVHLYMSGSVDPLVSVMKDDLPSISDFGGKFDPVQQAFFGSISREATSKSQWGLVRVNVNPISSNLIGDNKSVNLDGTYTPETDPVNPWITLGHGGTERILSGGGVQTESTCSASAADLTVMGASSGAYRGYMRFEPMLAPTTSCAVEFVASIDYYTFSLSERAHGLYIDDGQLAVHFAFLHYSPTPAKVVGTSGVFSIAPGDRMLISLDGETEVSIVFSSVVVTASAAALVINAAMGAAVASDDGFNHVQLIHGSGSSSYISIPGGSSIGNAAYKLGIAAGKYFGKDSKPEPRVSWFGDNPPISDTVPWIMSGGAPFSMIGTAHHPVMRITDMSASDYVAFTMNNKVAIAGSVEPSSDWKVDFRLAMLTYIAGDPVPGVGPLAALYFCGALANIDEGYGGKNVELHLAENASGVGFLNLVSYFVGTDSIVPIAQYAFAWNDELEHSFNVFTNKDADQLFVYADGQILTPTAGTPTYSSLGSAVGLTASVTFGSGGEAVSNVDIRTTSSVADWSSFAVFRDSKISDPSAYYNRYVGIYKGGDPASISSWAVTSLDWSVPTLYRIVRDPIGTVSVFINGSDVPSISVNYNPILLPPCASSFLKKVVNGRSVIAWGSLDPTEISRGRWSYLKYSMGKLTLTDRIVPPRHVLNQSNLMASPEHLKTAAPHYHYGFLAYSGGTPTDGFMSDVTVPAFTTLGEGIPPVPMSQDLEFRGGLEKVVTPTADVPPLDFIDYRGFLGSFEDDGANATVENPASTFSSVFNALSSIANNVGSAYENHRVRHATAANVHTVDDVANTITSPAAIDMPTLMARLSDIKAVFNAHVIDGAVHDPSDPSVSVLSPNPTDLVTSTDIANEIVVKYGMHLDKGCFHFVPASPPYFPPIGEHETTADATDYLSCIALLDSLKTKFAFHAASSTWHARTAKYSATLNHSSIITLSNQLKSLFNQHRAAPEAHQFDDIYNTVVAGTAYDVDTCIVLANQVKARFNDHIDGHWTHLNIARDPLDPVTGSRLDRYDYPLVPYQLQSAMALANDIRAKYVEHVVRKLSHVVTDEQHGILSPDATDLSSLIDLSNELKSKFNSHRTAQSRDVQVHVRNDLTNIVSSPDATDLETSIALLNDIQFYYDTHRTQPGVHGSSAFVRLEAPSGVLYEGMKFWRIETGVDGHVSSFSDDETWHIDAVKKQTNKSLTYVGTALPEKAVLVSVGARPGDIVDGDTLVIELDRMPAYRVEFEASDTTLSNVVDRINSVVSCASVEGSEIKISSLLPGAGSSVIMNGGTSLAKLGFEIPHHTPWFIVSENPSDVSLSLMTSGLEEHLRYEISGPSTSAYVNMAQYPMFPDSFSMTVRVRIASSPLTEDSGIYVGLSGSANVLGYTIAIGWGGLGASRYVKLQDMNSGEILDRIPFDWLDGSFHDYNLSYDGLTQMFRLTIDSP